MADQTVAGRSLEEAHRRAVAREFRRTWVVGLVLACLAYLAVVVALVPFLSVEQLFLAEVFGIAFIVPVGAMIDWHLLRSRFLPAFRAIRWSNQKTEAQMRSVLGEPVPASADEVLLRTGRMDREGVRARFGWFFQERRFLEARAAVEAWAPRDAVDLAIRTRWLSTLAFEEVGDDDLVLALQAAEAIPDPVARAEQQAAVNFEEGRRRVLKDEDPWPVWAAAAALLEAGRTLPLTDEDSSVLNGIRRRLVVIAVVPPIVILAVALAASVRLFG